MKKRIFWDEEEQSYLLQQKKACNKNEKEKNPPSFALFTRLLIYNEFSQFRIGYKVNKEKRESISLLPFFIVLAPSRLLIGGFHELLIVNNNACESFL